MEPMFLMLLAAGTIYLLLGDRAEGLFLLCSVWVIIAITLIQERKTQRALESLRDLSAPRALVLRDGQEMRIAGRDVVVGDFLILHEGDRIAADAVLLDGSLEVDESLLTGESMPVIKSPATPSVEMRPALISTTPAESTTDHSLLYASTVVTRGTAIAEVVAIATHTAIGHISADLAATREPLSRLQQNSRGLIRQLSLGALVLAAGQGLLSWAWGDKPILESMLAGITLAMAILPEEIPVVLTVFLALGAWRIAKQHVLTRRISAVETLGAITILAVDKTGTLTQNRMRVSGLAVTGLDFQVADAKVLPEAFHSLVEFARLATPGDPFDPTEIAIHQFSQQWLTGTEHLHADKTPAFEYALSSETLAITHVYTSDIPTQYVLATKGAPEAVVDLCHLDADRRAAVLQQVDHMARHGWRVLGVARGAWANPEPLPDTPTPWPQHQHDFSFDYLGLIALADPPRPEVASALAECRQAGVRVIMLTGDYAETARAIARQINLSANPQILTGDEIEALDDSALANRLRNVDLCARLKPRHKLRLVQQLRSQGEVVAMTGDGVNDAPALKAADVGIAMGERGTDVAREAASLVLLKDSFVHIVSAMRQGRCIDNNLRKAIGFLMAAHLPIIVLALAPTLMHWPALLLPVHVVLLEFLIDPTCSIYFEADTENPNLMERPPRPFNDSPFAMRNLLNPILQGAGMAAILLGETFWLMHQGWNAEETRSIVFCTLVLTILLLILASSARLPSTLFKTARDHPWFWRLAVGVSLFLLTTLNVPWLQALMKSSTPPIQGWTVSAITLLICVIWIALLARILQYPNQMQPEKYQK